MKLKERIVMRALGIKVSDDGTRWWAPKKHRKIVEAALEKAKAEAWRTGTDAHLIRTPWGMMLTGMPRTVEVRWSDAPPPDPQALAVAMTRVIEQRFGGDAGRD